MTASRAATVGWLCALGTVAFFGLVAVAMFARAMGPGLNHDEHQFIASGQLLATNGLVPYRDFAYFHTPDLAWVYAALFRETNCLLFAGRTFSTLCAWLSGVVIFALAWRALPLPLLPLRFGISGGLAALLFTNPIFTYTYFGAWNHALPVLLTLAAIWCHCRGARTGRRTWFFAGGLLVALAMGTRLTFAPLGLPFMVMAALGPGASRRERVTSVLAFSAGLVIGLMPVILALLQAPGPFLFDNFTYNGPVNAAFRVVNQGLRSPVSSRLVFLLKLLVHPANLVLLGMFLYFAVAKKISRNHWRECYPRALVLTLAPFAMVGSLAASPSYTQYFYFPAALGVLGITFGLAELQSQPARFARGLRILGIGIVISTASSLYDYRYLFSLGVMKEWSPLKVHEQGLEIRSFVPRGRILTLAPIFPLEGGLDIYPQLATGPFAWRTAYLLSPAERMRYGFLSADDLVSLLARQPPAAILVGYDKKLETAFVAYAKNHFYKRVRLSSGKTLWIRASALK